VELDPPPRPLALLASAPPGQEGQSNLGIQSDVLLPAAAHPNSLYQTIQVHRLDQVFVETGFTALANGVFAAIAGDEAAPRDLRAEGRGASLQGAEAFRAFWRSLSAGERAGLERDLPEFERAAKAADAPLVQEEPGAVEP